MICHACSLHYCSTHQDNLVAFRLAIVHKQWGCLSVRLACRSKVLEIARSCDFQECEEPSCLSNSQGEKVTWPKSRWLGASGDSSTKHPSAPSICKLSCTAYPSPFTFKVSLVGFFLTMQMTLKLLGAASVGAKVTAKAS